MKEKSLGQLRSAYPVPHFFLLLQPLRINQVLKATFLSSLSFTGHFGRNLSFSFVLGRVSPSFSVLAPRSRGTAGPPLGYRSSSASICLGMLALSALIERKPVC